MKRILFVDDEPRLLEGLQRMFRPQRKIWDMEFAQSGEEALAILEARQCDVIITDMRMPGMDGATLLQHVRERYPSVVRIVLSGHVEMEASLRVAPVAHRFLSKPSDPDKMRTAIESACDYSCLTDESIRRVVGAVGRLPSPPTTCAALLTTLQGPNADLSLIARIIEQDVGITAKVLQLVNSAFFGLRTEVTSVYGAVNYLGLETLRHLFISVEILRTFQPSPVQGFSLLEFEAHSRLAARIAARLPVPEQAASTAVVAALLHDAGKLVLATRLPEQFGLAMRAAHELGVPLHTVEAAMTGTSHADVGAYLLGLWGLPKSLVEAVRRHHRPTVGQSQEHGLDVLGVAHIADALAHELHHGRAGNGPPDSPLLDSDYVAGLGMADQIPGWRALARQAFEEGE